MTGKRAMHRHVVNGVTVEHGTSDGNVRGSCARVIDVDNPASNDFLAVNRFTVVENGHNRRPGGVFLVTELPVASASTVARTLRPLAAGRCASAMCAGGRQGSAVTYRAQPVGNSVTP